MKLTIISATFHSLHINITHINVPHMEMEVVELKVRIHCKACQKALRKSLCKIKGVKCVEIDAAAQKITLLGYVEHKAIVKAIHRTGRRAEPWPSSLSSASVTPRLNKGFRCILPF